MCRMGAPTANYLSVFAVSAPTPTWICGKVPVSKASGNLFVSHPRRAWSVSRMGVTARPQQDNQAFETRCATRAAIIVL